MKELKVPKSPPLNVLWLVKLPKLSLRVDLGIGLKRLSLLSLLLTVDVGDIIETDPFCFWQSKHLEAPCKSKAVGFGNILEQTKQRIQSLCQTRPWCWTLGCSGLTDSKQTTLYKRLLFF